MQALMQKEALENYNYIHTSKCLYKTLYYGGYFYIILLSLLLNLSILELNRIISSLVPYYIVMLIVIYGYIIISIGIFAYIYYNNKSFYREANRLLCRRIGRNTVKNCLMELDNYLKFKPLIYRVWFHLTYGIPSYKWQIKKVEEDCATEKESALEQDCATSSQENCTLSIQRLCQL